MARGSGFTVIGNTIDLHRPDTTDGNVRAAILVARGSDHIIQGNIITRSNNCCIMLDAGDVATETLDTVTVVGNQMSDPVVSAFMIPMLYVGEDLVSPSDQISNITIADNTFSAGAGWNQQAIKLNWGHGLTVTGNQILLEGLTATTYAIALQGRGESAASATYSSRWNISENSIIMTDGGGGGSSSGIRANAPFVDDSTVDARFVANTFSVPGNPFSVSASVVNPNITVSLQSITGLTYTSGVFQLGYPEIAAALSVTGDLTMTNPAGVIFIGNGVDSGNAQVQVRKADANSQTYFEFRIGTPTSGRRWLDQFDTSENRVGLHYDTAGNLNALRAWRLNYSGGFNGRGGVAACRLWADLGTTLVNGDFALSAGWGTTATAVVASNAKGMRGQVTVTSSGTGQAASPTITLTFPEGTWTTAPEPMVVRNGGTGVGVTGFTFAATATTLVITAVGTPIAAETYIFRWMLMG